MKTPIFRTDKERQDFYNFAAQREDIKKALDSMIVASSDEKEHEATELAKNALFDSMNAYVQNLQDNPGKNILKINRLPICMMLAIASFAGLWEHIV